MDRLRVAMQPGLNRGIHISSRRGGGRNMAPRVLLVAALLIFGASTFSNAQQDDLPVSKIAPGVFLHTGLTALMTRDNKGAIANVGCTVAERGVALINPGGSFREGRRLPAPIRPRPEKPIRYVIN